MSGRSKTFHNNIIMTNQRIKSSLRGVPVVVLTGVISCVTYASGFLHERISCGETHFTVHLINFCVTKGIYEGFIN